MKCLQHPQVSLQQSLQQSRQPPRLFLSLRNPKSRLNVSLWIKELKRREEGTREEDEDRGIKSFACITLKLFYGSQNFSKHILIHWCCISSFTFVNIHDILSIFPSFAWEPLVVRNELLTALLVYFNMKCSSKSTADACSWKSPTPSWLLKKKKKSDANCSPAKHQRISWLEMKVGGQKRKTEKEGSLMPFFSEQKRWSGRQTLTRLKWSFNEFSLLAMLSTGWDSLTHLHFHSHLPGESQDQE